MSTYSTDPHVVALEPTTVLALRETVPMGELPAFFDRAFHATMAAAQAQGVRVVGPPVGVYFGMPSDTVDVAAGFPVAGPVEGVGGGGAGAGGGAGGGGVAGVGIVTLPGGRAAQILHVGTYDAMEQTYGRLMSWMGEQGLRPGGVMWEVYLSEPTPDAPESWQTLIVWPLAG